MPKTEGVERVEFTRCPYDASPIEFEAYPAGLTLLSCSTCGAAWQWYKTWLRRVREPDRDAVLSARAGREPTRVIRGAPHSVLADAMWRQVTSSSSSTSDTSNTTPPNS
jgi:hypothetical protein